MSRWGGLRKGEDPRCMIYVMSAHGRRDAEIDGLHVRIMGPRLQTNPRKAAFWKLNEPINRNKRD